MSQLPSANDIWSMALPHVDTDEQRKLLDNMLIANLPERYIDYLYNGLAVNEAFASFLGEANLCPFFRVAGVLALLETMAGDATFDERDRNHVNRDKIALFWRIIGNEQPTDARTPSGDSWPSESMVAFQTYASWIFDDCHLFVYKNKFEQMQPFFNANVQRAETEKIFNDLRGMVSSPLNVEQMRQKLSNSEHGVGGLQRDVYAFFIKLGLLERSMWHETPEIPRRAWKVNWEPSKDQLPRLESPIPLTRACVKALCDDLAIQTVGTLDDTTRAQIRSIPERLTKVGSGFAFVPAIQTILTNPLINPKSFPKLIEQMKRGMPIDFSTVWGLFTGPKVVQEMKGTWFIKIEAKPLEVWKD